MFRYCCTAYRTCVPYGTLAGTGTSSSHLLDIPPGWPVAVASTGPVGESRWISTGAPGAISLPRTLTTPPGCTWLDAVVSDIGATQAHARLAGPTTPNAASAPSAKRRDRLISMAPIPSRTAPAWQSNYASAVFAGSKYGPAPPPGTRIG